MTKKSSFLPSPQSPAFIDMFGDNRLKTEQGVISKCPSGRACPPTIAASGGPDHAGEQLLSELSVEQPQTSRELGEMPGNPGGIDPNGGDGYSAEAPSSDNNPKHPLHTLRAKSVGSSSNDNVGSRVSFGTTPILTVITARGRDIGKVGRRDGSSSREDVAAKLGEALKKEKAERTQERARREVAEGEKGLALAALKAKAKR